MPRRLIFGCPHNAKSSTVAALVCSPGLTLHLTSQVTISGWSTSFPKWVLSQTGSYLVR
jgi:hypothetical protein